MKILRWVEIGGERIPVSDGKPFGFDDLSKAQREGLFKPLRTDDSLLAELGHRDTAKLARSLTDDPSYGDRL